MTAGSPPPYPLAPYRVLDLTSGGAMLAGQILADLGADVVAVEPPGGSPSRARPPFAAPGGQSLFWMAYARGKRSLTIDLAAGPGRERLRELAASADFVLESFPPGQLEALGLGHAGLAARNPRLVMVSITPFGQHGPKAGWAASGLTLLAASGVLLLTGDHDRPPVQVPGDQAMLHAGAEAAAAALVAHAARERDGVGAHVDVSAQEVMTLATQAFSLSAAWNDPVAVSRSGGGARVAGHHIRYVYPCKDGHVAVTFLFGNVIGPFTRRLFEWMHEEDAVDAATRDKDWVGYFLHLLSGTEPAAELERCTRAIETFTLRYTKAELEREALARGLLIVPVRSIEDVAGSQQLAARGFWSHLRDESTKRDLAYPGAFVRATGMRIGRWAPAPAAPSGDSPGWPPPPARPAPTADRPAAPALQGLKVLDFSWVYATPAGVRTLADYGATVIHVESPTRPDTLRSAQPYKDGIPGPERSAQYATIQANKLGLGLNLATVVGRDLARRLAVEWADVVVESFAPGTAARLGLDYATLAAGRSDLIMLSSSLNGQDGPAAHLAGFGTMGAHLAGFGELTGWADRPPAGPFTAYTDYTAPHFVAAALLAAIDLRRRIGRGSFMDLSQVEAALHFLTPALLRYSLDGTVEKRDGNRSPEFAPHGVYPCRNEEAAEGAAGERWIAITCREEDWPALLDLPGAAVLRGDARFAAFGARLAATETLDAAMAGWTRGWPAADLEAALQGAGIAAHRCSSSADLFADPHLAARGHWAEVPHPELGTVIVEGPRSRMSRTPPAVLRAGPTFGQDNETILRDLLGLSADAMAGLVADGVIEG